MESHCTGTPTPWPSSSLWTCDLTVRIPVVPGLGPVPSWRIPLTGADILGYWRTYDWQTGSTHPTGILSFFLKWSESSLSNWLMGFVVPCNVVTVRNEVAKVMFLQASVCPQGGCLVPGGCLLRGSVCSWGVSTWGGCLLLGGCLLQGGWVSAPRGWYPSMHWGRHPPQERQLLLQMVCILLECILVVVWIDFNLSGQKTRQPNSDQC